MTGYTDIHRTYVRHRNPTHPEAIHPERQISNRFVAVAEFFNTSYYGAFLNALDDPHIFENLSEDLHHTFNDLGIVHADNQLNDISPIVRSYITLREYWEENQSANLTYLFDNQRAHAIETVVRCTALHRNNRLRRMYFEDATGLTGGELDDSLAFLLEVELIEPIDNSNQDDADETYRTRIQSPIFTHLSDFFTALVHQAHILTPLVLDSPE